MKTGLSDLFMDRTSSIHKSFNNNVTNSYALVSDPDEDDDDFDEDEDDDDEDLDDNEIEDEDDE